MNVLVLTGTINTNNCISIIRTDICTRTMDYYISIKWWLENTVLKIVFIENSNNNLDFLHLLYDKYVDRLELLSFDGNNYPRHYGKAYGEKQSLIYAIEHSSFLKNEKYFAKIPGRYYIKNIIDAIPIFDNWVNTIDLNMIIILLGQQIIQSKFFITNKDFFYNEFNDVIIDQSSDQTFDDAIATVVNKDTTKIRIINWDYLNYHGYSSTLDLPRLENDNNKICIHRYLTHCISNPQPPGFADFIRGTITLFILSQKYDYKLYIDYNSHPIFKFLKYDPNLYINNIKEDRKTHELIFPFGHWIKIYQYLNSLFMTDTQFQLITVSFNQFPLSHPDAYDSYTIDEKSQMFIKNFLMPNEQVHALYTKKLNDIGISDNSYIVIHIRLFDHCLNDVNYKLTDAEFEKLIKTIQEITNEHANTKILVISNYYNISTLLIPYIQTLYFSNSTVIHLGDFTQDYTLASKDNKILDTIIDTLFVSNSSKIYCISQYGCTGFSQLLGKIYNIECCNYSKKIFDIKD